MVGTVKTRTLIIVVSLVATIALLLLSLPLSHDAARAGLPPAGAETGTNAPGLKINDRLPGATADAYDNGSITRINLGDYRGKWLVLIFYPADFTFVCPTELEEMANLYGNFTSLGAEVCSVSRDTAYVHKAWHDSDARVGKVQFPMIADTTGDLCRAFGTYNASDGLSQRAGFIFDPDGRLKAMEIHDNGFGRNSKELLRELEAAQFVREHGDRVCPAGWHPGEETIRPSPG